MKSIGVHGNEIRYVDRGDGLPLLLIHGFPLDHSMWAQQLEGLCGRCRVIAPDLRGFGRSPADVDCATMDLYADDMASLLDGLNISEPVVVCGLSMGGYVALQFWRRHRARLGRLVLCDTRAAGDLPDAAASRRVAADRVLREGPAFLAEAMLPRLFAAETRQNHPERINAVRSTIMAASPRGIAAAARGMAERPDMTGELAKIDCPTLLIVGRNDILSPPDEMRSMAQSIPGASFVVVAAAGHMSPLENPAEVNAAILSFLAPPDDG
jgi:3-oxoadipate enol-lactonase